MKTQEHTGAAARRTERPARRRAGLRATAFVSLLWLPTAVLAAPTLNQVSGTIANGNSMTISGSAFGAKSPAAPLVWDNFEGGPSGSLLKSPWITQIECTRDDPTTGTYSSVTSYGVGHLSVRQVLVADDPCWTRVDIPAQSNVYYTYRYYMAPSQAGDHTKMGRIACGNDVHCTPNMGYTAVMPDYYYAFPDHLTEHALSSDGVNVVEGAWSREEYWATLSTNDASNGTVSIWRDGAVMYNSNQVNTKNAASSASAYDTIFLPYYNEGGTRTVYVDDVYVDNTLARVEMCVGSTWATRGVCEVQVPTAWSDGSITATVNQGKFTSGGGAYVYVVNAAGVTNTSGTRVTIGGTSDTTPPGSVNSLARDDVRPTP